MRLILTLLAVANLRWAEAALARALGLDGQRDVAFAEAERRLARADRLMRQGRRM